MIPAATNLDLEDKAGQAVIAWLQTSPMLNARRIVPAAEESARTNGTISVNVKRGRESVPNSGVWDCAVMIEFSLRLKPRGKSMDDFCAVKAAIAERCEINPKIFADNLTKMRTDWHCYWKEIIDSNSDPVDGQHHYLLTLQITAMPVTFAQAEASSPKIVAQPSFI